MNKLITLVLITTAFISCSTTPSFAKGDVFVITSLNIENGKYTKYRKSIDLLVQNFGGEVVKNFKVVGKAKGTIKYGAANKLFVSKFKNNSGRDLFLKSTRVRRLHKGLVDNNLKLITGNSLTPVSFKKGELYILKISNYKQSNGKAQVAAGVINRDLEKRYGFQSGLSIRTTSMKNIERADEVGFFLYTKVSDQKRLYKDKSTMKGIGVFNKNYLTGYVYLGMQPN